MINIIAFICNLINFIIYYIINNIVKNRFFSILFIGYIINDKLLLHYIYFFFHYLI